MPIKIDITNQLLFLYDNDNRVLATYPVSSAKNGLGEEPGSEKTPRGEHWIHQKIGANAPLFSIFKGRVLTGECWIPAMDAGDFILSRILWLSGPQTPLTRYIYIHGTHDEINIGKPMSHGCIRMRNEDVINLFERVALNERVFIQ